MAVKIDAAYEIRLDDDESTSPVATVVDQNVTVAATTSTVVDVRYTEGEVRRPYDAHERVPGFYHMDTSTNGRASSAHWFGPDLIDEYRYDGNSFPKCCVYADTCRRERSVDIAGEYIYQRHDAHR